jgi:hypothetical protein
MGTITNKVDKRAWQSIKTIQSCTNMVDVNIHISKAILDTFKLRNLGLSKVLAMRNGTLTDWQKRKKCNYNLMLSQKESVRAYLLTFVPMELRKCKMYKNIQ